MSVGRYTRRIIAAVAASWFLFLCLLTATPLDIPPEPPPALWPEEAPHSDRILAQLAYRPPPRNRILNIYLPQGVDAWPDVRKDRDEFLSKGCPLSNCRLIETPNQEIMDAVIFRQTASQSLVNATKEYRHPGQVWIYHSLEPPTYWFLPPFADAAKGLFYSSLDPETVWGVFNWTATYRLDSDIPTPYGRFVTWDEMAPTKEELERLEEQPRNYARGKSRLAAWFVSHCHTASGREGFVQRLQQYMDVDVYGACGPLHCSRKSKKCGQMLDRDYHFYLAFENSRCQDYVSEKLFLRGLSHRIIPVVLGASRPEVERLAPPDSFIHIADFDYDPERLARHLKWLAGNATAYNAHFRWRRRGRLVAIAEDVSDATVMKTNDTNVCDTDKSK